MKDQLVTHQQQFHHEILNIFWLLFLDMSLFCPNIWTSLHKKIFVNKQEIPSVQFSTSILSLGVVAACFRVFPNSQHSPA